MKVSTAVPFFFLFYPTYSCECSYLPARYYLCTTEKSPTEKMESVSGFGCLLPTENPTHKDRFRSARTDKRTTENNFRFSVHRFETNEYWHSMYI